MPVDVHICGETSTVRLDVTNALYSKLVNIEAV